MIAPELEALLEPLERFESIRRRAARLGDRLCDLSYANPYEGARQTARQAIRSALDDERSLDLQYTPFGGQTLVRRAAADALRESHRLPFAHRDVVLTPGAMSALQLALRSVATPGGEVVIPVPCWLDHPLYVRFAGMEPRLVPLRQGDFGLDLDAVAAALSERTRAVVLTHPGNPTGRNYDRAALEQLGCTLDSAQERLGCEITLIADEVHRDFLPDGRFHSACLAYERTIMVYSFGKYHFIQGQRLGYAAVSPNHPERDAVASELVRWTRITGVATPTALMQRALPALLSLRQDHGGIERWRDRVQTELREAGCEVAEAEGTLFVYARTPNDRDDFDFVEELATRGVLVLPAPVFHHAGWYRLCLTGSERMLRDALPVLREACTS